MRLFCATAGILVLSAALFAAVAQAEQARTTRFAVMRNGVQIGTNTIQLQRQGPETMVRIVTDVAVRIAFVTVYRFDQTETERWVDGRLLAMNSATDDNGTVHRVTANRGKDRITVEADGRTTRVAGTTIPASLWNPALLGQRVALNPQDGSIMPIAVVDHGEEKLAVAGGTHWAHHYSIISTFPQDVWYDDEHQLVKVEIKGRDGSTIRYVARDGSAPSSVGRADRALPHEGTDSRDRPTRLGQVRHEGMPDMRHARPDFERDRAAGIAQPLGHPHRIVAQDLVAADMQQGRRQAPQIAVERRGVRVARIGAAEIARRQRPQIVGVQHRIGGRIQPA